VAIRIYVQGIGRGARRVKRASLGLATCAALCAALAACGGGHERRVAAPAATTRTSSPPAATTPPTGPQGGGLEHPNAGRPSGGGEEPIRVPATFTLRRGQLRPRTVSVPPFLAIAISVRSFDSSTRAITVRADRPYRLTVAGGGRGARTLPGQRAGRYAVTVSGGGRATLVVGGEPGP
jgi:hypothetical protein